jgi:hypothetical protein
MLFTILPGIASHCFSQEVTGQDDSPKNKRNKGILTGLYVGSFFANKYTSDLYDGYGYDTSGMKNSFLNSFMYRKIVLEYGGGYGQTDQIAQALGVNPGEWTFDERDMPAKVKYNPAFLAGIQILWRLNKKNAVAFNINACQLSLSGNFTIVVTAPPVGPQPPNYQDIRTFSITGKEQRLIFQAGWQRIVGENDNLNLLFESGAILNLAKFTGNQININYLNIDLSSYYTVPYYDTYRASFLSGAGWGAYAGLGINLSTSTRWAFQLLYAPSYEMINIGENPKLTLHHALGLRGYYNLW